MTTRGLRDRLARVDHPSGQTQTLQILDLSTYGVLAIMGSLGVIGIDGWPQRVTAMGLCLGFGVLYAWASTGRRSVRSLTVVFLLQTAAVAGAIMLRSSAYEAFGFLLMLLAVHVSMAFRPRTATAWVLALWGIHAVTTAAYHGPDGWFIIVFNLGIYLVCGASGHVLRELASSKTELELTLDRLRRAQDHIRALAVDEERGRLARDLHDSVKQNVFAAGMHIGTARALLSRTPPSADAALGALGEADALSQRAGAELGLVIHELRAVELTEVGLTAALQDYVRGWSQQSGIEAGLDVQDAGGAPDIAPEAQHALLRVAQESLANISRHSGAEHVDIRLTGRDPVRLSVEDDGTGFAVGQAGTGFGLRSMQERIENLGGDLTVSSAEGRGTLVSAQIGGSR